MRWVADHMNGRAFTVPGSGRRTLAVSRILGAEVTVRVNREAFRGCPSNALPFMGLRGRSDIGLLMRCTRWGAPCSVSGNSATRSTAAWCDHITLTPRRCWEAGAGGGSANTGSTPLPVAASGVRASASGTRSSPRTTGGRPPDWIAGSRWTRGDFIGPRRAALAARVIGQAARPARRSLTPRGSEAIGRRRQRVRNRCGRMAPAWASSRPAATGTRWARRWPWPWSIPPWRRSARRPQRPYRRSGTSARVIAPSPYDPEGPGDARLMGAPAAHANARSRARTGSTWRARCWSATGVGEFKIVALGARLGVSRSSFYWYFESRQEPSRRAFSMHGRCGTPRGLREPLRAPCIDDHRGCLQFLRMFHRPPELFDPGPRFRHPRMGPARRRSPASRGGSGYRAARGDRGDVCTIRISARRGRYPCTDIVFSTAGLSRARSAGSRSSGACPASRGIWRGSRV